MIKREIKYICISDIHLGNKNNTTKEIISNLNSFFNEYKPRDDNLDFIFIAGDLFDRLLDFSSEEGDEILVWIGRLMKYCAFNNIRLRILEGTPGHDRGQSAKFNTIDTIVIFNNLDYKYINTLSIEKIDDLNLSILYIPDEWHTDPQVTFNEVTELLAKNALTQVDIAMMHGQFTYQLPSAAFKAPKHNESQYLNIVKHYINIGHVHQFSTYERILAQGSFDRLTHGDEIPKGGLYVIIRPDNNDEFFFIENKHTKVFKTIKVSDRDLTDLEYLDSKVEKYPTGSYIRLQTKNITHLNAIFDKLKIRYIHYTLSKHNDAKDEIEYNISKIDLDMATYSPIVIRKENIFDLLVNQINGKYKSEQFNIELLKEELTGVL